MSTTSTATSHRSRLQERRSQWFAACLCVAALIFSALPAAAQGRHNRVSKDLDAQLVKAAQGEPTPATFDVIVTGNAEFVARVAQKHGA